MAYINTRPPRHEGPFAKQATFPFKMGDWILYATRTTLKSCEGTTGAKDILVLLDGPDKCSDRCIINT